MPVFRRAWKWLLARPEHPMRPMDIVMWWEARRIPYNLIVGVAGILSLALLLNFGEACNKFQPGAFDWEPLAIIIAPLIINFFYTVGWVVELLLLALRLRSARTGPALFITGIVFSLVVIAFPSVFWAIYWMVNVAGRRP